MARIVFIMMTVPEDSPYIKYYTDLFDELGIEYDFIIWERYQQGSGVRSKNFHVFNKISDYSLSPIKKFRDFYEFSKFANKIIVANNYDKIIVITIQAALFLQKSLLNNKTKYIIDIRDYSPILKIPFTNIIFKKLIKNSFATFISSPKFKAFLKPKNFNYQISHNIDPKICNDKYNAHSHFNNPLRIVTIGLLRDIEINEKFISTLGSLEKYELYFVGKGLAYPILKKYSIKNNFSNVYFKGSYKKEDELNIIQDYDFVNAYMPLDINSKLLLSNRLYNSVLSGRPIIVNSNTFQGELVKKYYLGISINDLQDLDIAISKYIKSFDKQQYNKGREEFLNMIKKDISIFSTTINQFGKR